MATIQLHKIMKQLRYAILPTLFCWMPVEGSFAQQETASAYIKTYAPYAQKLAIETGIPASVILGVAIIESGHGSSINARLLNNHFGIVGPNNLEKRKIAYKSVYKSYSSIEESYKHFCRVIGRKKFYSQLKGSNDYKLWLLKMNAYHYSSAGLIWVQKIQHTIEIHKLYKYDIAPKPNSLWSCNHM